MIGHGPFIAVDWGTTNRRAWRINADGKVADSFEDSAGITRVPPGGFAAEVVRVRERLGDLPMLLGGMIGSDRGWQEAPYVPCPASARDLAEAILWIDGRTGLVPGVCQDQGAADVMRGEEVQIIGALANGAVPADALVCLPGTHAKWAQVSRGRIVRFATWMTGEIFALLGRHSILAQQLKGTATPGADFSAGVAASAAGDPLGQLFRVRAAALLHVPAAAPASYISGLLIGAEVRSGIALVPGEKSYIIGQAGLCDLYAAAIAQVGSDVSTVDGGAAFCAGIRALIEEHA